MAAARCTMLFIWYLLSISEVSAFVSVPYAHAPQGRRRALSMSSLSAKGRVPRRLTREADSTTPRARAARTGPALVERATDDSNVKRITTYSEYLDIIRENDANLVVVKFFASWCRSCKAMDVKYRKLAAENKHVKFFEVDVGESPEVKQSIGIRAVPTVKIYAGVLGQIASFTCGPRKFPKLVRKVELCEDVPALAARMSRRVGMVEMVAKCMEKETTVEGMSESSDGMPNHSEASHFSEPVGLVKELVEKLPGQERLRRALAEATQLGDFPPPAPRLA